ncbi:hypothetical protein [Pelagibacterium halotolerans]|uniref:hypothetical protein n=1 Tax=Pelagibacterium halotolerans TaxID=531813 RepID=UPI00384C5E02
MNSGIERAIAPLRSDAVVRIARGVFSLSSLNVLGQALNFFITIPLAFLYGPSSFARFALFAVLALLISRIATFRLEEIIKFEERPGKAASTVFYLALAISVPVSVFNPLLGICVAAMSVCNICIMLLTARKRYNLIGYGNIARFVAIALLQLALVGFPEGLIAGFAAGYCLTAVAFALLARFRLEAPDTSVIGRNWRFSAVRLPAVVVHFLSTLVPLSIINARSPAAEAGSYALADRLIGGAATIVTLSIEYVLFGELDRHNAHRAIGPVLIGMCLLTLALPAVALLSHGLWADLLPVAWQGGDAILIVLSTTFASWVAYSVLTRLAIIVNATPIALAASATIFAVRTVPLLAGLALVHALTAVAVGQILVTIGFGLALEYRRLHRNDA